MMNDTKISKSIGDLKEIKIPTEAKDAVLKYILSDSKDYQGSGSFQDTHSTTSDTKNDHDM